jgi:uncharacterized protein
VSPQNLRPLNRLSSEELRLTVKPESSTFGLGLRPPLYSDFQEAGLNVDFVEIIAENYLEASALPRDQLRAVAKNYPVVAHGVSGNLLGIDPLNQEYIAALRDLIAEFDIPYVTDHLCWTAHRGVQHHDLLPAPWSSELVNHAVERIQQMSEALAVPFGVENLSTYVRFADSDMDEWEFVRRVVEQSGCYMLLDVNNVYVSSQNHRFSAEEYLAAMPWDRVIEVHLAGHTCLPSGLLHDTHNRPVVDGVWELYAKAVELGGEFHTLLEWDADIPELKVLLAELERARSIRASKRSK